jgi:hypothetical protein
LVLLANGYSKWRIMDKMPNFRTLVTATTPDVIAGLDPAIHHLKRFLMKIDGYAGLHPLRRRFAPYARV